MFDRQSEFFDALWVFLFFLFCVTQRTALSFTVPSPPPQFTSIRIWAHLIWSHLIRIRTDIIPSDTTRHDRNGIISQRLGKIFWRSGCLHSRTVVLNLNQARRKRRRKRLKKQRRTGRRGGAPLPVRGVRREVCTPPHLLAPTTAVHQVSKPKSILCLTLMKVIQAVLAEFLLKSC